MFRQVPLAILGLMTSLALGCDKQEATPPAPSTDATESVPGNASDQVAHSIKDASKDVATTVETTVDAAADQVAQVKDNVAQVKGDAAAKIEGVKAELPDVDAAALAEAQPLIDQAMGYIKENKFDLAEKTLAKLEAMKGSLPASIQSQIANAQKSLDAAKAMNPGSPADALGGIKLPGNK